MIFLKRKQERMKKRRNNLCLGSSVDAIQKKVVFNVSI
jgi:hypothetical protein